jgi:hypothetical protein
MRKYLVLTMALGALVALTVAGVATAEKPVKVRAGNLDLTFNGGFSPKALSKTKFTPISLNVSGKIATVDGTHPPALKEFILETDKNGSVQVKGYPTCTSGKLQAQDSKSAKAICGKAILGEGQTDIQIQFPEQNPIPVKSPLLLINGGTSGGTTTFFVHAYITVPTPAAVVTTVKITKIKNGRYGTKSVASIPKIAGGSGSVLTFNLNVDKKYNYKGKQVSVLTARCPDGKLQAKGQAKFSDGTVANAEVIRTCTPKG